MKGSQAVRRCWSREQQRGLQEEPGLLQKRLERGWKVRLVLKELPWAGDV